MHPDFLWKSACPDTNMPKSWNLLKNPLTIIEKDDLHHGHARNFPSLPNPLWIGAIGYPGAAGARPPGRAPGAHIHYASAAYLGFNKQNTCYGRES